MRTSRASEFFVNGHHCEIKYERREHYTGWLNGEQITSGHNRSHLRKTLINDAKYRVEREPEFWKVVRATYNFVDRQTDRDDNQLWVYNGTVMNQVTPMDNVGPAFQALLELESDGLLEEGRICMDLNAERMWRSTDPHDAIEVMDDEIEVDVTCESVYFTFTDGTTPGMAFDHDEFERIIEHYEQSNES